MWEAIGNVNSIWKFAAFTLLVGALLLNALFKPGANPPLKDLPREHRHAVVDKILEMQRESARTKYRLAWFVIVGLVIFVLIAASKAPLPA
jgi:hypothetical protein